ncbi:ferredoxin family protein [Zavarzinella formosa]|uniref:ferredoxin family protein n=1 Tax=Zavarzinella formosa TaxID=360055 RepID=UPI0002E108A4|nr:ferredoxin family protein [Zavarzinella formosa]
MAHVVAEPCRGCKHTDCVVVCPTECFYEGDDMLFIHPNDCIDCGCCVPECPVKAIYQDNDIPAHWISYVALNADMARKSPHITEKKSPMTGSK